MLKLMLQLELGGFRVWVVYVHVGIDVKKWELKTLRLQLGLELKKTKKVVRVVLWG